MRRIVKSFFGESVRTKRDPYMQAGFKSYENRFEEIKRPCSCSEKEQQKKAHRASVPKRPGLFQ